MFSALSSAASSFEAKDNAEMKRLYLGYMDGVNFSVYTEKNTIIITFLTTNIKKGASFKIPLNDYVAVKLFELLVDYMHAQAENDAG